MPLSRSLKGSPRRRLRLVLQENRLWMAEKSHKRGRSFDSFDSRLLLKAKDDHDLTLFNEMKTRENEDFLLHSIDDLDASISKLRSFSNDKDGFDAPNHIESSNLLNTDSGKNDYNWLLTPPDTPLFHSLDDVVPPPKNFDTRRGKDEKNQRPSISSARFHRSNSTFQSRGRTSSIPHSSSASVLHSSTSKPPSRRSSTPPNKLSTPSSMTVTPKLRGSSGSPIKGSRGSSSSPKLQRWQLNTTSFALDAPPNLRTSLFDRSSSYSRGSSPASRNGKQSYSRHGRQSISPTISRSVSSSRSHDHDRNSTHNKGSVVSYDESLQSASVRNSKKASRTPSPSSAPKRSFDLALRQMDHRKTPQNMFKPLMSSVPSSSFFVGKANTTHHPIFSRNSSVTTSSNASSDVGAGVALDTEGGGHDHANLFGLHEEMFDKMGEIKEDAKNEIFLERTPIDDDGLDGSMAKEIKFGYENCTFEPDETAPATSWETLCVVDHSVMDYIGGMLICSICGESFRTAKVDNMNNNICRECALKNVFSGQMGTKTTQHSAQMEENHHKMEHVVNVVCDQPYSKEDMVEFSDENGSNAVLDVLPDSVVVDELRMADQVHQTLDSLRSINKCKFKNSTSFSPSPSSSLRSDGSEGMGISVPLKMPNSTKGNVVQGSTCTASDTTYSEISCTRENLNATASNYSRSSSTTSSSLDLGSLQQMEEHIQRQLISMKDSTDSLKNDSSSKSHSSLSLSPRSLIIQAPKTRIEEDRDQLDGDYGGDFPSVNDECCSKTMEDIDGSTLPTSSIGLYDQEHTDYTNSCSVVDNVSSESLGCSQNSHISAPTIDPQTHQATILQQVSEIHQMDEKNITEIDVHVDIASNTCIENERGKISDVSMMCKSSSVSSLEMENHGGVKSSPLDHDCLSTSSNDIESESLELNHDSHAESIHEEESAVDVQSSQGQKTRSLTLEDATYTLLFCRSIIQDIAYKAAAIGVEKKQAYTSDQVSRPTVTILEKPVSNLNTTIETPWPKSRKVESKTSDVPPPTKPVNNAKVKTKVEEEPDDTDFHRQIDHSRSSKPPKLESMLCNCTVM